MSLGARGRQPRLPPARRRARAAHARPLAGGRAGAQRPARRPRPPSTIRSARSSPARWGPRPTWRWTRTRPPRRAGDVFLLCSDGLTGMVSDDEMAASCARRDSLRRRGGGARAGREPERRQGQHHRRPVPARRMTRTTAPADRRHARRAETVHRGLTADDVQAAVRRAGARRARRAGDHRPARAAATSAAAGATAAGAAARLRRGRGRAGRPAGASRLVLGGGYSAARQVYFVGTDDAGLVTLYRGLPYDLPLGVELYSEQYASSVPARTIATARRERVLDHEWRSRADAEDLVRQLERGTLDTGRQPDERAHARALRPDPGRADRQRRVRRRARARRTEDVSDAHAHLRRWCSSACACSRTCSSARGCPTPTPTCSRWPRLLAAFGLVVIYRIDAELAREQAQWFVIGLIAFCGHRRVPARPPRARALPLHDRRGGHRAAGDAARARASASRSTAPSWRSSSGRSSSSPRSSPRSRSSSSWPATSATRGTCWCGRGCTPLPVGAAGAAVRRRGASVLGWCWRSTLGAAETRPAGLFTASLAAILRERPSLKHFGPLLLVWGLAMLMLLFIRDLGSSLMFFGGFLALLYVATGAPVAGGGGRHDVPGRRHLLRQQREPRAGARGHLAATRSRPSVVDDEGYQIAQSLFAQADGGLFGQGFGQALLELPSGGRRILPAAAHRPDLRGDRRTRSGCSAPPALLLVYLLFAARGFKTAMSAPATASPSCWPRA